MKPDGIRIKSEIAGLKSHILKKRALETNVSEKTTIVFEEDLAGDEAREYMNLLLEQGAEVCAVFTGTEDTGYRYVIGSRTKDARVFHQILKENFGARGGGKPEMVQGSLTGARVKITDKLKALP